MNVRESDDFGILILLTATGRRLLREVGGSKTPSNEQLLVVLRRHVNCDTNRQAAAIDCSAISDLT
jgi:hypothetical protein